MNDVIPLQCHVGDVQQLNQNQYQNYNQNEISVTYQRIVDKYSYLETDQVTNIYSNFGKIYLGHNMYNQQKVLIKLIDKRLIGDEYQMKIIQREIQVLSNLKSQNNVDIIEYLESEQCYYIIYEWTPYGTLKSFLQQNGIISEQQTLNIIKHLIPSLELAYKQGYAYLTLCPENIVLYFNNIFKIANFNFDQKLNLQRQKLLSPKLVGMPVYLSPQIIEGNLYSYKADIWSFGLIIYEILFGIHPWNTRDAISLIKQIKQVPLRFPYEKKISLEMQDLIKGCLAYSEDDRFNWQQIFSHPIFRDQTILNYEKVNYRVQNDHILYLLKRLQDIVQNHKDPGNNLSEFYQMFARNRGGEMDNNEFFTFLYKIDNTIKSVESDSIFKTIDIDKDMSINLSEFKKFFTLDFQKLNDKISPLMNSIRSTIIDRQIDLNDLFYKNDILKIGVLDNQQFQHFIKEIGLYYQQNEIQLLFEYFDIDKNGYLSIQEIENPLKYFHQCNKICLDKQICQVSQRRFK